MPYNKTNWQDFPAETTPINAENLNKLETQYDEAVADTVSYAEQAAVDAERAEAAYDSLGQVTDSGVSQVVENGSSQTNQSLNARLAPVALGRSIEDFGARENATPAANVTAIRAAVTWAGSNAFSARTLYIPERLYVVNDDITLSAPGVRVIGSGSQSRIKQTARTKPIFRSCARDQYFSDFHVIGADDRDTIPDGGGNDLIRDNHPFANHCGVAFQYGSNGGVAERITGFNIAIVVGFWGWSDQANDYGGNIRDLTVRSIRGEDVWAVVFGRECDNFTANDISGSYKRISTIFADPHLIYLTSSNYVATLRPLHNVNVSDLRAYDSVGGEPVALKNIYGGSANGINVRNTPGVGVFAEVDNFTIGPYVADEIWKDPSSVGTAHSPSGGQVGMLTFSLCKNVTVAMPRHKNKVGNQAKSIVFTSTTNEDITVLDPDITTFHATDDLADNRAEVYVYGTRVSVVRPVIKMRGAARHGIRMGGPSPSVVEPTITGCGQAVLTDSPAAAKLSSYTSVNIQRSAALTLPPVKVNSSADVISEVLNPNPRSLVWDRGLFGSPSGRLIRTSSGTAPTLYGSAWQVNTDGRWGCLSQSATLPRYAVFESQNSNVSVESDVWLGPIDSGGTGTYSIGHCLRAVSEYTNLIVELRNDRLTVTYRSGTSGLNLASVASVTGLVYQANRKYRLTSLVFGDNVQVFVDGAKIIDATLTADQMTALGTATIHGVVTRQSLASRAANLSISTL